MVLRRAAASSPRPSEYLEILNPQFVKTNCDEERMRVMCAERSGCLLVGTVNPTVMLCMEMIIHLFLVEYFYFI
jgi:hypothetical protein